MAGSVRKIRTQHWNLCHCGVLLFLIRKRKLKVSGSFTGCCWNCSTDITVIFQGRRKMAVRRKSRPHITPRISSAFVKLLIQAPQLQQQKKIEREREKERGILSTPSSTIIMSESVKSLIWLVSPEGPVDGRSGARIVPCRHPSPSLFCS